MIKFKSIRDKHWNLHINTITYTCGNVLCPYNLVKIIKTSTTMQMISYFIKKRFDSLTMWPYDEITSSSLNFLMFWDYTTIVNQNRFTNNFKIYMHNFYNYSLFYFVCFKFQIMNLACTERSTVFSVFDHCVSDGPTLFCSRIPVQVHNCQTFSKKKNATKAFECSF